MPYKDPDKAKAAKRRYYDRNVEACKLRAAIHKAQDPVRERERLKRWHAENKDRSRAQVREWKAVNPDKVRANKERYRNENPGLWASYCGKRRALKNQASPAWANLKNIAKVYEFAAFLNAQGCDVEVDHIVPLNSPIVCGLHVEHNLQILPKVSNRSKSNRHWPDMP